MTIIAKGTFNLGPDQQAVFDGENPLPLSGDQHFDDNPDSSLYYESDFSYFKPKADLLLVGTCYVPGAEPRASCTVTFGVGKNQRKLHVIGQRFWESQEPNARMTSPIPFSEGPLRYEFAFGGLDDSRNPLGKGLDDVLFENESRIPLPNIEEPEQLLTAFKQRPSPAGFGPLSSSWHPRSGKCGTYDEKWLKSRWPWFPEDMDWSFFNSAPNAQQLSGYLRGDEELYFRNLSPDHSEYRSSLPGLRVRSFLYRADSAHPDQPIFEEVKMNLDTLWVDMDKEKLVLIWRGVTRSASEFGEDIQYIYFMPEALDDEPISTSEALSRMFAEFNQNEDTTPPEPESDLDAEIAETEKEIEAALAEADKGSTFPISKLIQMDAEEATRQAYRAQLQKMGKDPAVADQWQPESSDSSAALAQEVFVENNLEEIDFDSLDSEMQPIDRQTCLDMVAKGESLARRDLRNIDLSQCKLDGIDFSESILIGADFRGAQLTRARFTQANLSESQMIKADLRSADFFQADLTSARAMDADLSGARLEGASLSSAILHSALLVKANLRGADFSGADLRHAVLKGCNMDLSDFSYSHLDGAQFISVTARGANFETCQGESVDFSHSNLERANFSEGCILSNCVFVHAIADESIWDNSDLKNCDFRGSNLRMASFESTTLSDAVFLHCALEHARFIASDLSRATFERANLFQSTFEKANLRDADMSYANLYEAETRDADLSRIELTGANLKMTKLLG